MSIRKCLASAVYGIQADEPVGSIENDRFGVRKDLEGGGGKIFEGTALRIHACK
jgi:hypothetical protein